AEERTRSNRKSAVAKELNVQFPRKSFLVPAVLWRRHLSRLQQGQPVRGNACGRRSIARLHDLRVGILSLAGVSLAAVRSDGRSQPPGFPSRENYAPCAEHLSHHAALNVGYGAGCTRGRQCVVGRRDRKSTRLNSSH